MLNKTEKIKILDKIYYYQIFIKDENEKTNKKIAVLEILNEIFYNKAKEQHPDTYEFVKNYKEIEKHLRANTQYDTHKAVEKINKFYQLNINITY